MQKKRKPFTFKQFTVSDENCAMKLSTDAVILGAWTCFEGSKKILDIGTGCGILALIAAQKSDAEIIAIDIDKDSIDQAQKNFTNSKWSSRLGAIHSSLQDFYKTQKHTFDTLICNPPYFENSMHSPQKKTNLAKHNETLDYQTLFGIAAKMLSKHGKLNIIIPVQTFENVKKYAAVEGFFVTKILKIYPTPKKAANRLCIEFRKEYTNSMINDLIIRDENLAYTSAYKKATQEFYTIF